MSIRVKSILYWSEYTKIGFLFLVYVCDVTHIHTYIICIIMHMYIIALKSLSIIGLQSEIVNINLFQSKYKCDLEMSI